MKKLPSFLAMAILFPLLCASQDSPDRIRTAILQSAHTYLGTPYVYGAESPRAFDCSGFVRYVYREAAGLTIPRSSKQIWRSGTSIPLSQAKPGDILVYDTVGGAASHVAILGENGTIIHAVSDGPKTGVITSSLQDRYFGPRFMGARIFIPEGSPAAAAAAVQPQRPQTPPEHAAGQDTAVPADTHESKAIAENVSVIGFTITNRPEIQRDLIPALRGSSIQYAISNETGRDGVFEILFYKMHLDPSKHQTLRRERVSIKAGSMLEIEPFTFTEAGQYRLILKTHDNIKRIERTWRVIE